MLRFVVVFNELLPQWCSWSHELTECVVSELASYMCGIQVYYMYVVASGEYVVSIYELVQ